MLLKRFFVLFTVFISPFAVDAQDTLLPSMVGRDSVLELKAVPHHLTTEYPYNKKRVRLMTAANIIGYGGTMATLYGT